MATKQVRKPGRPAKKTRRSFAAGGVVDNVQQKFGRSAQLAAAEQRAMGSPAAPQQKKPQEPVPQGQSMADIMREIRAKNPPQQYAAGGVVRLAQGEKVPKPEWEMDPRYAVAVGERPDVVRGHAPQMLDPRTAVAVSTPTGEPIRGAGRSMGADQFAAARAPAVPDTRGGIGAANMQRGEAAPSGPGYRGPRAPVETYTGPVAEFLAGSSAPAPGVASRSSQGAPSRAMPVTVAPDARRPGGTVGRIGRGPAAAPTDADLFSPAEAAPVASPGLAPPPGRTLTDAIGGALDAVVPPAAAAGAVPSAPARRGGPARQQGTELTQQYNPREVGQYGATTVYRRDVPQDQQGEYGQAIFSDSARGASRAGFDQDLRQYGAGASLPGDDRTGAVGRLAGQRAMADNALLQKWYSMPENQRGRMPASVENAKYRGADDTETAFNVARARIMQTPMDPGRQAQALANLDKTRADMLNQSQQTRQTGDYQQGQLGNERERTGVARQQVEQAGQNQQAQMAHQQRMAQLALDQGVAEGALLPDEEYQKDRALDDTYNAAYEQRRTIRERARRVLMARLMKGETLQDVLANPGTDDERALLSFIINPSVAMRPQKYAGGGMVSPQAPVYGGAPDAQRADPLINAYRVYTTQSKAMGAPTVPFAEFSSLYAGAAQGPMQPPVGMAGGGAVPAAGKMVIDTDPDAEEDSIPAMIDGEHPAALNHGEFVFPTDVTSYYGTKMLSGMIEKARTGGKPSGSTAKAV